MIHFTFTSFFIIAFFDFSWGSEKGIELCPKKYQFRSRGNGNCIQNQ